MIGWKTLIWNMANWQAGQFPEATVVGALNHLKKEINKELTDNPNDVEEWADAFHLVIQGGVKAAGSLGEFQSAIEAKLQKNCERSWPSKPDEENTYQHERPSQQDKDSFPTSRR